MHANVHADRSSWRLPPDETLQVADPKAKKAEVGEEEELSYPGDDGHNWRSIIYSLLVIAAVVAGIVTAIYLLGYVDELLYWSGRRMSLEEYLQGELSPNRLQPSWISSSHFVFQADDGGLAVMNTNNDSVRVLVTNHTLRQLNVKGYQCSADLRYVLFQHNLKSVYRNTYTAHYTIYDVSNDHHIPLRLSGFSKVQPQRLQYAGWLGRSSALLIVAANDIYLKSSPAEEDDHRLTFTGESEVVYNGIPDWLYQEDILSKSATLWGSHDGTHILYASFNDSAVGVLNFPWFTSTGVLAAGGVAKQASSFPQSKTLRYPTPGFPNPTVKLWVLDIRNLSDVHHSEVQPPKALAGQDYYMTSASWIGNSNQQVSAVWMNRAQNLSIVSTCLAPNWTCIESHVERAPEDAWLSIQPHPVFSPNGDSFLMLAPILEEHKDFYTHIKHVTQDHQRISVISHGRYEVEKILAWDTTHSLVYYLASMDKRAGQRHLYVVRDPTADDARKIEPKCITCNIGEVLWNSRYNYVNCTHFNALVNPCDGKGVVRYVLQCEGPGLPMAGIHNARNHSLSRILYDTRPHKSIRLGQLALPSLRSFEVPLPQGAKAQVQLLLPPSWREELRDAAFPVLVEVNGRPGSKAVTDEFKIHWGTYMSSHNDIVYVRLDVRGAQGQSNRALYRHLGGVEVQDQLAVLRYLLDTFKFLDVTRVGVWGWGYGGYVTTMLLGSQQKIFKCGIAVSPITDWLYYNSAFTERVLGLPAENYKGYVEADATQRARHIPSHSLYLVHGLADLTAPYQHGVSMARALTDAGVLFRYQCYADEGHNLVGSLEHVYRSMEDFLQQCLSLDTDDPVTSPPEES